MKTSAFSLTANDWALRLHGLGKGERVLKFFLKGLYGDRSIWRRHLSPELISSLAESFDFNRPALTQIQESSDGTVKFLVKLDDEMEVETVIIPFRKRYTVCLSTQVGCAMNCSFCYTGTQGMKRNLRSGEIVGQYLSALNWLREKNPLAPLPAIVFMGQGEPLHNVDEVLQSVRVLNDKHTIGVGHRMMTLSTVGYLPGLPKLLDFPQINFALSLHSPFDEERSQLIPVNQRFPLHEVLTQLDRLPLLPRQFITYEYLLIKDFNMGEEHAEALAKLLSQRKALVNLIPFNPFPGSRWKRPSAEDVEDFRQKLVERKLRVMVRTTKGDDILAACGQLKVQKLARSNGSKYES